MIKKIVQDKRQVKLTEKIIDLLSWKRLRDTGQIFKLLCNLEIQNGLYSDELIKWIFLGELLQKSKAIMINSAKKRKWRLIMA